MSEREECCEKHERGRRCGDRGTAFSGSRKHYERMAGSLRALAAAIRRRGEG